MAQAAFRYRRIRKRRKVGQARLGICIAQKRRLLELIRQRIKPVEPVYALYGLKLLCRGLDDLVGIGRIAVYLADMISIAETGAPMVVSRSSMCSLFLKYRR